MIRFVNINYIERNKIYLRLSKSVITRETLLLAAEEIIIFFSRMYLNFFPAIFADFF
jgi:hypothetical protein